MKRLNYNGTADRLTAVVTLGGVPNMAGVSYYFEKDGYAALWGPVGFTNTDPNITNGRFELELRDPGHTGAAEQRERYFYVAISIENLFPTPWPCLVKVEFFEWAGGTATLINSYELLNGNITGMAERKVAETFRI